LTIGKVFSCTINGEPSQKTCLNPGVFSPCRPTVQLTFLHNFDPPHDGGSPRGSLVFDPLTERLYGVAGEGGPHGNYTNLPCDSEKKPADNWHSPVHWFQCPGNLFSIYPDGSHFVVEYAFSRSTQWGTSPFGSNSDGYHPYGSLAVTSDGVLHGVTVSGGAKAGGVLFSFDPRQSGPNAHVKLDHSFCAPAAPNPTPGCYEGILPYGSLAVLSDGHRVIGTAEKGGRDGAGTVWVWDSSSQAFGSVSLTAAVTGQFPRGGFANSSLSGAGAFGMTYNGVTKFRKNRRGFGAPFYFDPNAMTVFPYPAFPFSIPSCLSQFAEIQTPYVLPGNHILLPREAAGSSGTGALYELDNSGGIP